MHGKAIAILDEKAGKIRHGVIRPDDIDPDLPQTFGKYEVEQSVGRLIRFFQSRGCWCPFTLDELRQFYEPNGWDAESAFYAIAFGWFDEDELDFDYGTYPPGDTYIVQSRGGTFFVTEAFVERCGKARKKREAA